MSGARLAGSVAALVLAASCTHLTADSHGGQASTSQPGRTVVVTQIVDGDTLRVAGLNGGRDLGRVRLLGVDAPEVGAQGEPGECYAAAATDLLGNLAPVGTRVQLVVDSGQANRDSYGRILAYVDGPRGDVGEHLLNDGAASLYRDGAGLDRATTYRTAAQRAITHGTGMWGTCAAGRNN